MYVTSIKAASAKAKKKNSCVSGSLPEKNRVGRLAFFFFFFR